MGRLHVSLVSGAQGYRLMGSHRKKFSKWGCRTKKFEKPWCTRHVQAKHTKSEYIMVRHQLPDPALNSVKTIGCQSHAKCVAKHLKPGVKHLHACVC